MFLKPFFEIFKRRIEKESRCTKVVLDPRSGGIPFDGLKDADIPPAKRKRYKRTEISSEMTKVESMFRRETP